jgi:hypothetical protein
MKTILLSSAVIVVAAAIATAASDAVSWSRLSEQLFRVDKWSVCRG